jgi:hypothetical protein
MAVTINGVLCNEEVNGNSEDYDVVSGPQATKVYLCDWGQRWAVVVGILGFNNSVSIGGAITLQVPMRYPDFAGTAASLYASTVSVEGLGTPTQGTYSVAYGVARITVNFRSFPWSFQGLSANDFNNQIDPTHPYIYAEQNMSFTSEFVTVPGTQVKWLGSGVKLGNRNWGFTSPIVNFTIALKDVPYIPAAQIIIATASPINSATYLGVSAGKLLFNGAETHQSRMSNGNLAQEVAYSFSYRPIAPWDYDYDGATNVWDKVVDLAGNPIRQRSDLSSLIPVYFGM